MCLGSCSQLWTFQDILRLPVLCLFSFIQDKKSIDRCAPQSPPTGRNCGRESSPPRTFHYADRNGKRAGSPRARGLVRWTLSRWADGVLFRVKSTLSSLAMDSVRRSILVGVFTTVIIIAFKIRAIPGLNLIPSKFSVELRSSSQTVSSRLSRFIDTK